jgi:hypothetical protein
MADSRLWLSRCLHGERYAKLYAIYLHLMYCTRVSVVLEAQMSSIQALTSIAPCLQKAPQLEATSKVYFCRAHRASSRTPHLVHVANPSFSLAVSIKSPYVFLLDFDALRENGRVQPRELCRALLPNGRSARPVVRPAAVCHSFICYGLLVTDSYMFSCLSFLLTGMLSSQTIMAA